MGTKYLLTLVCALVVANTGAQIASSDSNVKSTTQVSPTDTITSRLSTSKTTTTQLNRQTSSQCKSTICTCPISVTSSTTSTQSTKTTSTTDKCTCPACATSSMTSAHSTTQTIRPTPTTAPLSTSTVSDSNNGTSNTERLNIENKCYDAVRDVVIKRMDFIENHGREFMESWSNHSSGDKSEVKERCTDCREFMESWSNHYSGDKSEVKERCIGVFLKPIDSNYSIILEGCVNIDGSNVMVLSYSEFVPNPCPNTDLTQILSKPEYLSSELFKRSNCTCPLSAKLTTTTTQSTILTTPPTSHYPTSTPYQCTCPTCATSLTPSTYPTTKITRATLKTGSLSTSTDSVSVEPNSDKLQEACIETPGLRFENGIIIGVSSFLAGVLVVLLFLCLLHLKRASQLCFRKSVKPPEPMTSERATKKVLAKHMLSDRTDPPTQTNVLYFKNESEKKDLAPNTPEDEYAEIDNPNTRQDNYTGLNKPEVKPPVNDTLSTEEHVYIGLEFDDKTTDNKHPAGESDKTADVLRETAKTGSELFDRTRDSNISGHDYFVLQNENFRNSHQPDTRVSDNMNRINDGKNEGSENTYFELEKSPENTYFELEKNPENTYFQLEKGPDM